MNVKYAVQAVILNDKNEVLAVSRKDNHLDFGLPGGKVEEDDLLMTDAIAREVYEETGLIIDVWSMELVFSMHRNKYMGFTYYIKDWEGEINTKEPHIVKWTNFGEITNGSFGEWNSLVADSMESMGIKIKR